LCIIKTLFVSDYRVWRTSSSCPRAVPYEVACWFARRSRSSRALLCVSSACYVACVRASFARCRAVRASSPFLRVFCHTSGSRVARVVRTRVRSSFALSCCFVRRTRAMSRVSFTSWRTVSCIVNLLRLESLVLIILVIYLIVVSVVD
jgi:hypothetical protein